MGLKKRTRQHLRAIRQFGLALSAPVALALCAPVAAIAASAAATAPLPDAVAIGTSDTAGPIYTTARGMTLYRNSMDEPETGAFGCTDARYQRTAGQDGYPIPGAAFRKTCIDRWQPYRAGPDAAETGPFGVVKRPNGIHQWAFGEAPLYTSTRDLMPGDTNGTMGFRRYGRWQTVPVDTWFPPGLGLVRKVQGLLLASGGGGLLFTPGKESAASEESLEQDTDWRPVTASELAKPRGEFAILQRADGSRQWAFRGRALHRPRTHLTPHRIQQIVEADRWRPVLFQAARPRPKFVTMHMSVPEIGWVYGDAAGRTLYAFYCFDRAPDGLHCDELGDAAAHRSAVCGTGEQCAREWRPAQAEPSERPTGNWAIAQVPHPPFAEPTGAYGEGVPRVRAWTWHGRPVYTFAGDRVPGDVLGHGIEARSSGFGAITVLGDEFPVMP